MPLVTKARRRVRQPAWQKGPQPRNQAQRDALAIQANHEQKFTRAFNALLRELMSSKLTSQLRAAIRNANSVNEIISSVSFLDPSDPNTVAVWEEFIARTERAFTLVIDEAVENEKRKRGWKFEVRKIEMPEIPVNPAIGEFTRLRSLLRAVDMSDKERDRIRLILTEGLASGARPSTMIDEIQATVGLTTKQLERLRRKLQAARDAGMSAAAVEVLRERTAAQIRLTRARAIARTESNAALQVALQETWRQAQDEGVLEQGAKKKWIAMDDERTSDICNALDNQEVGLNDNFATDEGGGFVGGGPPGHVNCRSTLVLVFPD